MNNTTIVIGIVALLYGLYTANLRSKRPGQLRKLKAMKESFGAKAGNVVHLIAYTVLPLVVGVIFIFSGIRGVAVF